MTPEIAERIAFHLRWHYESKESNSPNSELLERATKDRAHEIIKDETQISEEVIGGFMTAMAVLVPAQGIAAITGAKVKKQLESFEANYLKHY